MVWHGVEWVEWVGRNRVEDFERGLYKGKEAGKGDPIQLKQVVE